MEQLAEAQQNAEMAMQEVDEAVQQVLEEQQAKEMAVQQTKKALQLATQFQSDFQSESQSLQRLRRQFLCLSLGVIFLLCCLVGAMGYMVRENPSVVPFCVAHP